MTFAPTPRQALFLWKMICAETPELREPIMSKATPTLNPAKERKPLIDAKFLEQIRRGRSSYLVLTDRAWRWAAECTNAEIMKSNSSDGAVALQGLLRALVPFLKEQGLSLAEIIQSRDKSRASAEQTNPTQPSSDDRSLESRIRHTCGDLSDHDATRAIRLSALRAALPGVARHTLDTELRRMQQAGSLALYRDDNTARVTQQDTSDALMVGDEPRHLLYLKD